MYKVGDKVFAAFNPLNLNGYEEDGNIVEGTVDRITTTTISEYYSDVPTTSVSYTMTLGLIDSVKISESQLFRTEIEAKDSALALIDEQIKKEEDRLSKLMRCRSIVESK